MAALVYENAGAKIQNTAQHTGLTCHDPSDRGITFGFPAHH